ncbi:MAG: 6-carboxytetrahydropterin synthase [Bacteriovoracia bacterium]
MNKVYLTRRENFCASHRLHEPSLSDQQNADLYGYCNWKNGHGHNYEIFVTVCGNPDPKTGMIINLVDLKKMIHEVIINRVDHRHLNFDVDFLRGINPTAENLVVVFWNELKKVVGNLLYEVKLQETENNVVVYRGE